MSSASGSYVSIFLGLYLYFSVGSRQLSSTQGARTNQIDTRMVHACGQICRAKTSFLHTSTRPIGHGRGTLVSLVLHFASDYSYAE